LQKIISVILLISLSLHVTGYHFLFHLRQWEIKATIKKRVRRNLDAESTEQFVFSIHPVQGDEQPEWEGDDEFRYQGEMYDIIEKKIVDGKIYVRCISDKEETQLIRNYQQLTKNEASHPISKKRTGLLFQLINMAFTAVKGHDPYAELAALRYRYRAYASMLLATQPAEVLTPPPQHV
jgi:hypothetical protein